MLSFARIPSLLALAFALVAPQIAPPPPAQMVWLAQVGTATAEQLPTVLNSLPEADRRTLLDQAWQGLKSNDTKTAQARLASGKGLVRLARAQGDQLAIGHAVYAYGTLNMIAQVWTDAENSLGEAGNIFATLGEHKLEGRARLNLTNVYNYSGRFEKAIAEGGRAMAALVRADDWENQSFLGSNLSDIYLRLGKIPEARTAIQQAREIAIAHHDGELTASADLNLANIQVRAGEIDNALDSLARARSYYAAAPDPTNLAVCDMNRGVILLGQNRYSEADLALQTANDGFRALDDALGLVQTGVNLGALRVAMGRYAEGAAISQETELNARSFDPNTAMIAAGNYASALLEQGLYPEAYEAFVRFRQLAHDQKAGREEDFATGGVGSSLGGLGRRDSAITAYTDAIKKLEADGNLGYARLLRTNLDVLRSTRNDPQAPAYLYGINRAVAALPGNPGAALRDAGRFLASSEVRENVPLQSIGYFVKGKALRRLGRGGEALAAFEESLNRFASQRSRVTDPLFATFAMKSVDGIAGEMVEAGAVGVSADRLLRDVEQANGESVRRSLMQNNVQTKGLTNQESDGLTACYEAYQRTMLDADLRKLLDYEMRLRVAHPRWAGGNATPVSLGTIASAMGPNRLGIAYVASERSVFALCLTNEGGRPKTELIRMPVAPDAVRSAVGTLRGLIVDRRGREDTSYRAVARRLYEDLVLPIAKRYPKRNSVVLSANGPLSGLPLSALVQPNGKYLAEDWIIVEAPSLSAWQACRERDRALAATPAKPPVIVAISRFGSPSKSPAERGPKLIDLKGTADETAAVKKWSPDSKPLTEAGAGRHNVLSAITEAGALHFATHAIPDNRAPLLGAIVLAPEKGKRTYLMARELTYMTLNARFAFLSSCATASGTASHEGALGLSWAFMIAGVPTVVASRWKVDDKGVVPWTKAFYSGRASNLDVATAAHQASVALIKAKAKPADWAAWTVFGSG